MPLPCTLSRLSRVRRPATSPRAAACGVAGGAYVILTLGGRKDDARDGWCSYVSPRKKISTGPESAGGACIASLTVSWKHFFFFQAEDGIRDYKVTGVQTCALPI